MLITSEKHILLYLHAGRHLQGVWQVQEVWQSQVNCMPSKCTNAHNYNCMQCALHTVHVCCLCIMYILNCTVLRKCGKQMSAGRTRTCLSPSNIFSNLFNNIFSDLFNIFYHKICFSWHNTPFIFCFLLKKLNQQWNTHFEFLFGEAEECWWYLLHWLKNGSGDGRGGSKDIRSSSGPRSALAGAKLHAPHPPQMQTAQNCNSLHSHCWPCLHSPAHITSRLWVEALLFSHVI